MFGTYQGTQLRNVSTGNTAFVLTPAQRDGDFSSLLPRTQLVDPVSKQPFAGNRIPADRINAVTRKLLPLIPASNSPDGFIVFDRPVKEHENQVMGRIDYNLIETAIVRQIFPFRAAARCGLGNPEPGCLQSGFRIL